MIYILVVSPLKVLHVCTISPTVLDNFFFKCLAQFRALFGASRVPQHSKDTISVDEKSNHVAVMCCNQLFHFKALWPQDGDVAVDEGDIGDILQAISIHAHKLRNHNNSSSSEDNKTTSDESLSALGVLTSLGRKQWAKAREEMIAYSPTKNMEGFNFVDSALFVLVLDDYIPKNKHEAAANMLHGSYELSSEQSTGTEVRDYNKEYQSGTCTNRWYDKLQIIVTADGGAGINFEHSAIDGHTALRFVSDIYADTVISFAQSITKLVNAHDGMIPSVIAANIRRAAVTLDNQGRTTLDGKLIESFKRMLD
jgi:carnitine O-acetyltransferase